MTATEARRATDSGAAPPLAETGVSERDARQVAEAAREAEWRAPSFGKELFLGRFRLDLVHPLPPTDAGQQERGAAFLARLRDFLEREVDGAAIERDAHIPDRVLRGLADIGCLGMKIDTEYGGLGLSQLVFNQALVMIASANPSIGALVSAHQSIGVPQPVKLFGSAEQKQRFLPRCARTDISAFLLTEPDVGSDPARLATTATRSEDGNSYVLNGQKLWTTNGVVAGLLVVMARVPRSDGHRGGITAFVVEGDAPGVTVEHRNAFMGLRGIENGVTRLEHVTVPAENRIGAEGAGLKIALTTLNTGRLSIPAVCVGATKWCTRVAREWSAARVQWGKPIHEHEAVATKIAYMAATSFALESVLELSSRLADAGRTDIRIEAALAKLYASEHAWRVADELVQVRGGRGYETADSLHARGERGAPAEQILRDLRINRIFEGSTEIMHLLIAREAVDTHLAVAGDIIDPDADRSAKIKAMGRAARFYAAWLPTLAVGPGHRPGAYAELGPLAGHLRYVERTSRRLARWTFYGMARWQGTMERRQAYLARLVDIGAELFAITATCVKADDLRAQGGPEASTAVDLADAFCAQARIRIATMFTALWRNTDRADGRLARRVVDGDFAWQEVGLVHDPDDRPWIAPTAPPAERRPNVHRNPLG